MSYESRDSDQLLDLLGSSTRRRMLALLADRPHFVSELSDLLEVGRKAVIEHLATMEDAGIIQSRDRPVDRGRPRKYYEISETSFFKFCITPQHVEFSEVKPARDMPKVDKLHIKLDELEARSPQTRQTELQHLRARLKKRIRELESEWVELTGLLERSRRMNF
ncbi:MAG TPA: ArsR family transcriptional regulator [archaeon]|nr:ArsR family transcriptional regulator [archaeon]